MVIVPFEPQHVETLNIQSAQAGTESFRTHDYRIALQGSGPAFSALHDGHALICAGLVIPWEGRGIAWAMVGGDAGPHFVAISKAIKRFLSLQDLRRIDAYVEADFVNGNRWIKMFGFEFEGLMRSFSPEGRDCNLYALVRKVGD